MYAIENDLGRFEAETEQEARVLVRKAQRAALAARKISEQRLAQARLIAQANGFRILENKVRGQYMNLEAVAVGTQYGPRQRVENHKTYTIYETETGTVEIRHAYGTSVVGAIMNRVGFTLGVFIRCDRSGQVQAYALGAWEGEWQLVTLPGVTSEGMRAEG